MQKRATRPSTLLRLAPLAAVALAVGVTGDVLRADDVDFAREIRPLLADACYNCHGPDAQARQADLRLDPRDAALKAKVLSSGEMLRRLTSSDPDVRMPPADSIRKLRPGDRARLVSWLGSGASWPEDDRHWSFVPPVRPRRP